MGARLPQRFIPALKDYSGMGGASGAAGEGKADQGIAKLIKTTLLLAAARVDLCLEIWGGDLVLFRSSGAALSGAGDLSAFPGIPAALVYGFPSV